MGAPTEIYLYGIHFWLICLSVPLVMALTYYVYLPVFYGLQVTSTYEVRIILYFLFEIKEKNRFTTYLFVPKKAGNNYLII